MISRQLIAFLPFRTSTASDSRSDATLGDLSFKPGSAARARACAIDLLVSIHARKDEKRYCWFVVNSR